MEEFLNDLIGKRMEQVYQEKDGEQYDPFNEELELKVQKVIRKLPPKQGKVIFDYMTEISNNNSDLNEFYYRMGLRWAKAEESYPNYTGHIDGVGYRRKE